MVSTSYVNGLERQIILQKPGCPGTCVQVRKLTDVSVAEAAGDRYREIAFLLIWSASESIAEDRRGAAVWNPVRNGMEVGVFSHSISGYRAHRSSGNVKKKKRSSVAFPSLPACNTSVTY